ncbi:hypothetical protein [Mucilaginibacter gynuensis]
MKNLSQLIILPILVVCVCLACNSKQKTADSTDVENIPAALKDESSDVFISKRVSDSNLMTAIYRDIAGKDSSLSKFEDELAGFKKAKADTIQKFKAYYEKADEYYTSAVDATKQISDTLLRQKMLAIIKQSQSGYTDKTKRFQSLINAIEHQNTSIDDSYTLLQLVVSLPEIEKYEDGGIAQNKGIAVVEKKAGKVLRHTKQLANKYQEKLIKK